VTDRLQEWLSLGGAIAALIIGFTAPEAGMVTVGLGALSVPGVLKLVVQRGSTKVKVEAQA
jgi:hypothetical protein